MLAAEVGGEVVQKALNLFSRRCRLVRHLYVSVKAGAGREDPDLVHICLVLVEDKHVKGPEGAVEALEVQAHVLMLGPFLNSQAAVDAAQGRVCIVSRLAVSATSYDGEGGGRMGKARVATYLRAKASSAESGVRHCSRRKSLASYWSWQI